MLSRVLARDPLWQLSSMAFGRDGSGIIPDIWKKPLWKRVLALPGSVGQRAFAHSIHALERSREV